MEELIMVALKFKANLRSRVSALLTSSVERCGLRPAEESHCCREGDGGVTAWTIPAWWHENNFWW